MLQCNKQCESAYENPTPLRSSGYRIVRFLFDWSDGLLLERRGRAHVLARQDDGQSGTWRRSTSCSVFVVRIGVGQLVQPIEQAYSPFDGHVITRPTKHLTWPGHLERRYGHLPCAVLFRPRGQRLRILVGSGRRTRLSTATPSVTPANGQNSTTTTVWYMYQLFSIDLVSFGRRCASRTP